jgi:carbon storage regulator
MLVLSRKSGERIVVPHLQLVVTVLAVKGNAVRLGISAPEELAVYRGEVWEHLCQEAHDSARFAAELTSAVYPLLLGRGLRDAWLKVELDLWEALAATVRDWARQRPTAVSAGEVEAWREGLLGALTRSALAIALENGVPGSRPEVESGMGQALRQVLGRYNDVG